MVSKNMREYALAPHVNNRHYRECGDAVNPNTMPLNNQTPAVVKDHLIGAILSLFLFLPVGVVALIFALQSRQKLYNGDCTGAEADSKTAGTMVVVAIVLGMIGVVIWFAYGWFIGTEIRRTNEYMRSVDEEIEREIRKANAEAERLIRSVDYYY